MQKLYFFVLKLVAAAQARAYLFILPCLFPQKNAKLESLLEVSFGIQSCWLELPAMSNQNDNVLLKFYLRGIRGIRTGYVDALVKAKCGPGVILDVW